MSHYCDKRPTFATHMTREKIINSAIDVLNDDFSAPLDRIAEKAGVSRRTLHRHFKDRMELLKACACKMLHVWQESMLSAYNSSTDPIKQLEYMLYAGIDCGITYSFLNKLRMQFPMPNAEDSPTHTEYKVARDDWFGQIPLLQKDKIISDRISIPWIRILFINMISSAIEALHSGDIAPNDVKKFAWYSLRKSIGIKEE